MKAQRLILPVLAVFTVLVGGLRADDSDIRIIALFENKAILMIDGHRRVMAVGDSSPEGVTLTGVGSDQISIKTAQGEEVIALGVMSMPRHPRRKKRLVLYADDMGFFHTSGKINGRSVRFLVDTGANTVAINSALARRLGIDYRKNGSFGLASTAGGVKPMYSIRLKSVEIGGMRLDNIDAGVLEGPDPDTPLLGMSALRHVEMQRVGNKMELIER